MPYSCKSASSIVTVFNRIYISPSFHISFILISLFFFDRSNCPYLIVRRPFTLTVRRLCVQSVTLILYLCIVSRSGSAAPHHTFFFNASIYDVSSFLPLPLINSFLITCTCINDISLPSRIPVQVVPIQCAIQYCDQQFDNNVIIHGVGGRHYENDSHRKSAR